METRTAKTQDHTPEYAVYIHLPANQNNRFWERTSTTRDKDLALEQAEMLFSSQKYPKVEVVKRRFCPRAQRAVSETLRVFDTAPFLTRLWRWFLARVARF